MEKASSGASGMAEEPWSASVTAWGGAGTSAWAGEATTARTAGGSGALGPRAGALRTGAPRVSLASEAVFSGGWAPKPREGNPAAGVCEAASSFCARVVVTMAGRLASEALASSFFLFAADVSLAIKRKMFRVLRQEQEAKTR